MVDFIVIITTLFEDPKFRHPDHHCSYTHKTIYREDKRLPGEHETATYQQKVREEQPLFHYTATMGRDEGWPETI